MSCSPVLSNYLINKFLGVLTNQGSYSSPTTVYLALYNTSPTAADTGTEVSGSGYARQAISWNSVASEQASNSASITFPTATGNWTTANYWALRDASTGGNLLMFTAPNTVVTVLNGQTYPTINASQLVIAFQ